MLKCLRSRSERKAEVQIRVTRISKHPAGWSETIRWWTDRTRLRSERERSTSA